MRHGTSTRRGRALRVAAALPFALLLALLAESVATGPRTMPAALADTLDDQIAQLKEMLRTGEEAAAVTRIGLFEKSSDKRVDVALLGVVRASGNDRAAREAMRVLAVHKDPGFLAWARTKIGDSKMRDDLSDRYAAMLDALPFAGPALKSCAPALLECIEENLRVRPDVTTRAVRAYAGWRDKSVVPKLIDLLDAAEGAEGGGGGGARGALPAPPPNGAWGGSDPRANIQAAKDEILSCLKALTGADGGDAITWKLWWSHHGKTFRVPGPEPEWARISEFSDDRTGLVLRKPESGELWTFEKSPFAQGRARMKYQDGAELLACVDVMVYAANGVAGPDEYARSAADMWRSVEFSGFVEGGDPEIAKRKLGGRDFAVVTARGFGAGSTWGAWDQCERRLYVAAVEDASFVCLEVAARDVLDAAHKAALWKALESVSFARLK